MLVIIRFTTTFQLSQSSYLLDSMIYGTPSFSLPLLRLVTGLHWRPDITWQVVLQEWVHLVRGETITNACSFLWFRLAIIKTHMMKWASGRWRALYKQGKVTSGSVKCGEFLLDSWTLKMGLIGCPETSLRNNHYSLRNKTEWRSSQSRFAAEAWSHGSSWPVRSSLVSQGLSFMEFVSLYTLYIYIYIYIYCIWRLNIYTEIQWGSKNRDLRGTKGKEVIRRWRRLRNEELCDLYAPPRH